MFFLAVLPIQTQLKSKACGTEHFVVIIVELQIQTWQLKYTDYTGGNKIGKMAEMKNSFYKAV